MELRNKDIFHPQNYYDDGRPRPVKSTGGEPPRKQIATGKPYYRGRLSREEIVARLEKERQRKRLEAFQHIHEGEKKPSKRRKNMQPVVVLEPLDLTVAQEQTEDQREQSKMEPKLCLKPLDLSILDANGCYIIGINNADENQND